MPFKRSFLKVKQCDRSRRQYSNILSAFTAGALNQGMNGTMDRGTSPTGRGTSSMNRDTSLINSIMGQQKSL